MKLIESSLADLTLDLIMDIEGIAHIYESILSTLKLNKIFEAKNVSKVGWSLEDNIKELKFYEQDARKFFVKARESNYDYLTYKELSDLALRIQSVHNIIVRVLKNMVGQELVSDMIDAIHLIDVVISEIYNRWNIKVTSIGKKNQYITINLDRI